MPQTSIVDSSRTVCNNGECVQITMSCVNGDCSERRIIVDGNMLSNNLEGNTVQENNNMDGNYVDGDTSSDDSSDNDSDNDSDNGCKDYKKRTIAIIFSGIDVTIPSFILSLVMLIIFMTGLFKIKKKK